MCEGMYAVLVVRSKVRVPALIVRHKATGIRRARTRPSRDGPATGSMLVMSVVEGSE